MYNVMNMDLGFRKILPALKGLPMSIAGLLGVAVATVWFGRTESLPVDFISIKVAHAQPEGGVQDGSCDDCCGNCPDPSPTGPDSPGGDQPGGGTNDGGGGNDGGGSSCSDCSSCSSCSSCDSCSSTPFAYIWNGKEYVMDNDVMFGKPSSRFSTLREGKVVYEKREITPDLYALQDKLAVKDGKIKLQIKEIEPEVSAIDHVKLQVADLREGEELIVKSDFSGWISSNFRDTGLVTKRSNLKVEDNKSRDFSSLVDGYLIGDKTGRELNTGDYLEVSFRKQNKTQHHYLLLESWYRDWTMGELYLEQAVISPMSRLMKRGAEVAFGSLLGFLGFFGFLGQGSNFKFDDSILAGTFGTYVANADVPYSQSSYYSQAGYYSQGGYRSLVIYKKDPKTGAYSIVDVIEPRYAKPSVVAVSIPEEAYDDDGFARIRIAATKKHKISGLAITIDSDSEQKERISKSLQLTSATLSRTGVDYRELLNAPYNGQYLETLPGDVLDLQFEHTTTFNNPKYFLTVGGVYANATKAEQARAGNWTMRLDKSARRFLVDVYQKSKV